MTETSDGFDHTPSSRYAEAHLIGPVGDLLTGESGPIVDLGCGNGLATQRLGTRLGVPIVGVDRSSLRLGQAKTAFPNLEVNRVDFDDALPAHLRDRFEVAVSTEVIEHMLFPRNLFRRAIESGARRLILSTPYHGYTKDLVLALLGRMDDHWQSTVDYGHVKFFSEATLTRLAAEEGWETAALRRVGRVRPLAKSMIADFRRAD